MNAEAPIEAISPPHAVEAEQTILGACMARPSTVAEFGAMLTPDMFYDPLHADIYQAILDRWQAGEPFTPEFIMRDMRHDARFADKHGIDLKYISRLRQQLFMTPFPDAAPLAGLVIEMAARRSLLSILEESKWDLEMNPAMTAQEAIDRLAAQQLGAMEGFVGAVKREASAKVAMLEYMSSGGTPLVSTSLSTLDAVLSGFGPGESIILGGRPSMGKTALGLAVALQAARRGEPVVFYSYEMSLVEITARCVSMLLAERGIRVPYTVIRGKRDKLHEMEKVKDALDILDGLPLIIVIANGMTIDTLRADVLRQKTKLALTGKRLTLAVIDYLGLIRAPEKVRERIQQIGYISRSIKDMAKHAGIPVLTLAQLNRALEGRQDKRPQLSDLRESGDIEQDADTVMFIHRESYYLARDAGKASNAGHQMTVETSMGDAEVIVSKNRHGPVKVVKVGVDLPVNRFFDLHEEGATY